MFVDDVVLVDENTNVSEGKLKRWLEILKNSPLKISKTKREFLEFRFNNMVGGMRMITM